MPIYPDATSGIWEISNHDLIYPSGVFYRARINPDCGGCFDLYSDFKHQEIYDGDNPGYWLRDRGGDEIKGIGLARLVEDFRGKSGMFQPNSGSVGYIDLNPCSLKVDSFTYNCRDNYDYFQTELSLASISGYLMEMNVLVSGVTPYLPSTLAVTQLQVGYLDITKEYLYYRIPLLDWDSPLYLPSYTAFDPLPGHGVSFSVGSEIAITDLSFSGENVTLTKGSGVSNNAFLVRPSGEWIQVGHYVDNFWKNYPSGSYYPDGFPSGVTRLPITYSVDKISYDGRDIYRKICNTLNKDSYTAGIGNECVGTPGEPSGQLDYISVNGPAFSNVSIGSGDMIYTRSGYLQPGTTLGSTLRVPVSSGVYLDSLHIQKIGCETPCGAVTPTVIYDKFFNKPQPVLKYHYLTSTFVGWRATAGDYELVEATVCPSNSLYKNCYPPDLNTGEEYIVGEWETVILNPIDDTHYESSEITINRSKTIPSSLTPYTVGGWEFSGGCEDEIVEASGITTNAVIDSITLTQNLTYKCYAEFQGDTNFHFFIKRTSPSPDIYSHPRPITYEIYPKRILSPYFNIGKGSQTGVTTGTTKCIEAPYGLEINSTLTSTPSSGTAEVTWSVWASGYIELDWTP